MISIKKTGYKIIVINTFVRMREMKTKNLTLENQIEILELKNKSII